MTYTPSIDSDPREEKLPRWARELLGNMRSQVARTEVDAAAGDPGHRPGQLQHHPVPLRQRQHRVGRRPYSPVQAGRQAPPVHPMPDRAHRRLGDLRLPVRRRLDPIPPDIQQRYPRLCRGIGDPMPTTEPTTPDVPPYEPEELPESKAEPVKTPAPERGPLDPITRHLWRYKRPERVRLLLPFVDHEIRLERWYGRVAANGDETYFGTILAVATTTIGSAADLVILKTTAGQVWAISTAQVAYLEAIVRPPTKATRARAAAKPSATATAPVRRGGRRKKIEEVPDEAA